MSSPASSSPSLEAPMDETRKERGILFSAPMVLAILDGRKSQTRRLVGPKFPRWGPDSRPDDRVAKCPHGAPGDRLWVRETFAFETSKGMGVPDYLPPFKDGRPVRHATTADGETYWEQPHYRATDPAPELSYDDRDEPGVRWKSSIFMPRWASRITLEITEVRVQRLQDISEEDATKAPPDARINATGGAVALVAILPVVDHAGWRVAYGPLNKGHASARVAFSWLWDSINGERAPWDSNPWVWALTFRRIPQETNP